MTLLVLSQRRIALNLRNADAERFIAASMELAKMLLNEARPPETKRALQERLSEAMAMAGICKVQKQDWEAGGQYYLRTLALIEEMERESGLDNFLRIAFFNSYRNLEHMHRGMGDEAKAQEVAQQRMAKLGAYEDTTLTEKDVDPSLTEMMTEATSKGHQ